MDLRRKLHVSSSWTESASLQHLLCFADRAGRILDYSWNTSVDSVVLSQCAADEACYIHVAQLRGLLENTVVGVGLQSGSRNVEVYVGEDYVCTCRGSLMEDDDQLGKMYNCQLDLPSEYHNCDELSLKLLSLKGQPTVCIKRLTIALSEDQDRRTTQPITSQTLPQRGSQENFQELLDSLPPLSANAPPFLGSLISTLKSCHTSQERKGTTSSIAISSGQPSLPPEVAYMMSAFLNMRPEESTCAPQDTTCESEVKEEENPQEPTSFVTLDQVESLLVAKMQELESKLIKYINTKFDEMSMKASEIDLKVKKELDSDILTMHRDEVCESAEHNQYHTMCRPES